MRVSLVRAVLLATGLGIGAVHAEPSQTGTAAIATAVEEAEKPAHVPASTPAKAPSILNRDAAQTPSGNALKPDTGPATSTAGAAAAAAAATATDSAPAAAAAGSAVVTAPPPPPAPTLLVAIDLTNQRMSVSENGKAKYTWSISSGREGYRTPTGTFRPSWMAKMWYSKQYDDAPMPHSVFFNRGIAVHATQSTGMLGRPASHGCIRLAPANAATFYKLVSTHGKGMTRIKVHGVAKDSTPVASRRKRPADEVAGGRGVRELPPYYAPGRYSGRQRYSYSGYGNGGYNGGYGGPAPRYVYPGDQAPGYYRPARPYRGYAGPRSYYD